ncbi:MAG: SpoIID/LytB domain-containing protein [Planctomycetota bacterium]
MPNTHADAAPRKYESTPSTSPRGLWHRMRVWLGRAGPMPKLAMAFGFLTLLLIGCLHLTETGPWQPAPAKPILTPPSVDRLVRVRLSTEGKREADILSVTTCFRITDAVTGSVLVDRHTAVRRAAVRCSHAAGGIDFRGEHLPGSDVLLTPEYDASIILNGKTYRGELRIQRRENQLIFVNQVDIESYLCGVLRGELHRYFHREAFMTQAIAARTYVLYNMQRTPSNRIWDVLNNESSQMYIGVSGEDRIAVDAVKETGGQVCVWDDGGVDRLFCTYYSSTCGGVTQRVSQFRPNEPGVPPLCGNVLCRDCYLAPHYRWGPVSVSRAEVTKRVLARYPSLRRLGTIEAIKPKDRGADGRITHVELVGADGSIGTLVAEDFRLAVGGRTIKSTCFDLEIDGDDFVFKNGKGYGHGVGLCQHGMEAKARRGWNHERILATYYPGAKIKTAY